MSTMNPALVAFMEEAIRRYQTPPDQRPAPNAPIVQQAEVQGGQPQAQGVPGMNPGEDPNWPDVNVQPDQWDQTGDSVTAQTPDQPTPQSATETPAPEPATTPAPTEPQVGTPAALPSAAGPANIPTEAQIATDASATPGGKQASDAELLKGVEDLVDPELLATLRKQSQGQPLSLAQIFGYSALAAAAPDLYEGMMNRRAMDVRSARDTLSALSSQANMYNKEVLRQKNQDKRTAEVRNAMLIQQAYSDATDLLGDGVPPYTGDMSNYGEVSKYVADLTTRMGTAGQVKQFLDTQLPLWYERAADGIYSGDELVQAAMEEASARFPNEPSVPTLYQSRMAALKTAADFAKKEHQVAMDRVQQNIRNNDAELEATKKYREDVLAFKREELQMQTLNQLNIRRDAIQKTLAAVQYNRGQYEGWSVQASEKGQDEVAQVWADQAGKWRQQELEIISLGTALDQQYMKAAEARDPGFLMQTFNLVRAQALVDFGAMLARRENVPDPSVEGMVGLRQRAETFLRDNYNHPWAKDFYAGVVQVMADQMNPQDRVAIEAMVEKLTEEWLMGMQKAPTTIDLQSQMFTGPSALYTPGQAPAGGTTPNSTSGGMPIAAD